MDKRFFGTLACGLSLVAGSVALTSCSDDVSQFANDGSKGQVHLLLDVDPTVASASQGRATLAEIGASLTAQDFTVRLTSDSDPSDVREWTYTQFDGVSVKTGTYILTAYHGNEDAEGFDAPYFAASQKITVEPDRTTTVTLTAALANAAVEVAYTEAFSKYMTSYETSVRTAGKADGYDYPADAAGELFVTPGLTSLYVTFTTPQGKTATLRAAEFEASARHKYLVTVDVNGGEVGDAVLTVTFDDSTVAETYEFTLSDELLNAPAPQVTPLEQTYDVTEGDALPGQAKFSVVARNGLARVTLATEGAWLLAQGWPAEIDLLSADASMQAKLRSLGMNAIGLWNNPDQMAVVDLTETLKKIRSLDGQGATSRFILEVEDKYGKINPDWATITYTFTPIAFEITGNTFFMAGASEAVVTLDYNGTDPQNNITWEYLTDRGVDVWDPVTPISVTALSRGAATYQVVLPVMVGAEDDYVVRATFDATRRQTYTIKRGEPTFSISASANDVFATNALVTLTPTTTELTTAQLVSACKFEVSADGGSNWQTVSASLSGSQVYLAGLPSGSTLKVRASNSTEYGSGAITTEAATQLPNSGFEDWVTTDSASNWELLYPATSADASAWGTNNPMTTSQGSNFAYCRISGTISTSVAQSNESNSSAAARSGSNAAILRTVGWGSGNTATSTDGSKGVTKYIDAGLLHLGSSRSSRPSGYSDRSGTISTTDLTCGMAFASRPSKFSFWYKYYPKNSADKGLAEVYVYDGSGNVLASGTATLASASSYTQCELPLTYSAGAAKAAKIYVKFLSTNSEDFLTKTSDNLSGPGFANLSRGTYMGSQLYIDDLSLTY